VREAGALSDGEILELVKAGSLGIDPFSETRLTPNGYDVSIRELLLGDGGKADGASVMVKGGSRFVVSTREYFRLPDSLMANVWLRTSWARRGVLASFGVVDAGFEGELTLGAFATQDVEVGIGKTFAQLVFVRLGRAAEKPYARRSGNYQGQRGVTLGPKSPA
jgi:dCTP deaminase